MKDFIEKQKSPKPQAKTTTKTGKCAARDNKGKWAIE